jgi:hypothetical protein
LLLGSETEEDGMKDEDNMMEKKNEMWGERQEGGGALARFLGGRKRGLNAEGAEDAVRRGEEKGVFGVERKSPPIANGAKGGAPSSLNGWRRDREEKSEEELTRGGFGGGFCA